ncbi:hypothetical protein HYD46_00690 [Mycoplasmopsis bovis]|nr:hypothetical protein [Mycoplasmopsis bovis]QQH78149.1 hypothetical protein HYD46_00690 [Mycoplasmopsis bovis]
MKDKPQQDKKETKKPKTKRTKKTTKNKKNKYTSQKTRSKAFNKIKWKTNDTKQRATLQGE